MNTVGLARVELDCEFIGEPPLVEKTAPREGPLHSVFPIRSRFLGVCLSEIRTQESTIPLLFPSFLHAFSRLGWILSAFLVSSLRLNFNSQKKKRRKLCAWRNKRLLLSESPASSRW